MRTLHYTLSDAQQWAMFSGDNNPIHFSLEAARAIGGSQLSVHGMRALLDVKQAVQAGPGVPPSERHQRQAEGKEQRVAGKPPIAN